MTMADDGAGCWKNQLAKVGIDSVPVLKGLAEFEPIVEIWLDNLRGSTR